MEIEFMGATTAIERKHIILISILGKLASSNLSCFPVYCMIALISLILEL